MKYETAELKVAAVATPRIATTAALPSPTTAGEHMQTLDIVRGKLEMAAVTPQPGSCRMTLGSEKARSLKFIQGI